MGGRITGLALLGLGVLAMFLAWPPLPALGQDEEPEGTVALQTVTVEAERPDWEKLLSPGAVSVIIPDDFKGEQKKLPEYLQTVPGLHVERRGGEGQYSTVTMRGSTSAQVNVYVDGVLQNTGGFSVVDLSLIPMSNVARIEVYRGYTPARFSGSPIGGVINIVTKKPQGFSGAVSAGVKSLHGRTADATITSPLLGGSLLLGFHRDQSHGDFKYPYVRRLIVSGPNAGQGRGCDEVDPYGNYLPCTRWRQSNSYQNTDVLLKWQDENWYAKGAWKRTDRFYPDVLYSARSGGNYVDTSLVGPLGFGGFHLYQLADQYDFLLGRRQTSGPLEWGLEYYHTEQSKEYANMTYQRWVNANPGSLPRTGIGQLWNRYDTVKDGGALDGNFKLGENNLVEFRLNFDRESLEMDGNKGGSWAAGGYNDLNSGSPVVFKRDNLQWQLSDTLTLNEAKDLQLTGIVRYDKVKDSGFEYSGWNTEQSSGGSHTTYGLALKKEIEDTWTMRGTWGGFVRYPNFFELYGDGVYVVPGFRGANYELPKRETGHQWDLGLDWRGDLLWARSNLSATYFARRTFDHIMPQYGPLGNVQYVNGGDTQAHGLELEAGFKWGRVDLDLTGTYMKTQMMRRAGLNGLPLSEGDSLLLQPEWEGHGRLTWRPFDDSLSLFAEHHYTGEMLENYWSGLNNDNVRRQPMNVTGLGLRYKSPWGVNLTGGVDDVFNNRPEEHFLEIGQVQTTKRGAFFPSPGRTWYLTLEYLFGGGADSGGEGAQGARPAASAGGRSGAEKALARAGKPPFYVSPKLIHTKQRIDVGQGPWSAWPGAVVNQFYPGGMVNQGPQTPIPGGGSRDSSLGAALAFGVDFYRVGEVPLRLELEASTHSDSRLELPGLTNAAAVSGGGLAYIFPYSNFTKINYSMRNVFLNLYYDFHNRTDFTPFIGAGAGLSDTKIRTQQTIHGTYAITTNNPGLIDYGVPASVSHEADEHSVNFAWNLAAGLSYRLTDDIDLDLSYRYLDTGYKKQGGTKTFIYASGGYEYLEMPMTLPEIDLRKAQQVVLGLRYSF